MEPFPHHPSMILPALHNILLTSQLLANMKLEREQAKSNNIEHRRAVPKLASLFENTDYITRVFKPTYGTRPSYVNSLQSNFLKKLNMVPMGQDSLDSESTSKSNQDIMLNFVPTGVHMYPRFVRHNLIHPDPMTKWNLNRVIN
ncbi:uncharacterized protein LOC131891992 [Tigriopus californicus]|uniref:uncharacterized protein LOC131891992 n=1 Tax=Tigriopus californicus TaxID=6832 RepID=UPI0027DA9092|nr:uncharacterized protein LOC131891992 [Tigriopus californicus]